MPLQPHNMSSRDHVCTPTGDCVCVCVCVCLVTPVQMETAKKKDDGTPDMYLASLSLSLSFSWRIQHKTETMTTMTINSDNYTLTCSSVVVLHQCSIIIRSSFFIFVCFLYLLYRIRLIGQWVNSLSICVCVCVIWRPIRRRRNEDVAIICTFGIFDVAHSRRLAHWLWRNESNQRQHTYTHIV